MATKEKAELGLIETYLPAGLSDEELSTMVVDTIKSIGASGPKDMGKVMGALTKNKGPGRYVKSQYSRQEPVGIKTSSEGVSGFRVFW